MGELVQGILLSILVPGGVVLAILVYLVVRFKLATPNKVSVRERLMRQAMNVLFLLILLVNGSSYGQSFPIYIDFIVSLSVIAIVILILIESAKLVITAMSFSSDAE